MKNLILNLPWNKKIEILRTIKGWSQEEAAKNLSKHQKIYWSWEKGKNYPNKRNRELIAEIYDVNIEELFNK